MTTNDKKAAAEARAAALRDHDRMIVGALQDERRGYVQRGQADRVALVDEQLEFYRDRLGEDVPADAGDDEKADSAATDDGAADAGAEAAAPKVTKKA